MADGHDGKSMGMRGVWVRSRQRFVHLVLAAALGVYLYSPLGRVAAVELVIQVLVFPALVLSGLLLWQAPRLRRWLSG